MIALLLSEAGRAAALTALTVWMGDWLNILALIGIGAIFCCVGDAVNGSWRTLARWFKRGQGVVIAQLNTWKATTTSSDFVVQAQQDQT